MKFGEAVTLTTLVVTGLVCLSKLNSSILQIADGIIENNDLKRQLVIEARAEMEQNEEEV